MKNLLRTTALLLIFNSSFLITKAQWVSIPDSNFAKSIIYAGYGSCLQGNSSVGWQMDTTCSGIVSATDLTCSYSNSTDVTGIQYFDSLLYFDCKHNEITFLPSLPNRLSHLLCEENQILSWPALPNSLIHLNCSNNLLTDLPILPLGLSELLCDNNQLDTLLSLPPSLTQLSCAGNQISSLPPLPNTVKWLDISENHINFLTALPSSLISLGCYHNLLNNLPSFPNGLKSLVCGRNQLTNLPALPNSLYSIDCRDNLLTSLPALPDSIFELHCLNNPNLHCFPELKKIVYFEFSNTGITCLPNYPQRNLNSIPPLISYPLCDTSSFNIYGCGSNWNIAGLVYQDSISNCFTDATEHTFVNLKVLLYENGVLHQQNFTASGGNYSFNTDLSTYQYSVDTTHIPFIMTCPDSGYYTSIITLLDSFDNGMNFGLRCKPGFDLVAQSVDGGFRPGNTKRLNVNAGDNSNFYGANCTRDTSGSVQLIINGSAHYASAASGALTPTSVVNDTITWSIADFGAVNFFTDFNINVATDTTAVSGSQICFTLIVNPIAGDNNPANNTLTHCFTVVGSFDPNEKEVYPAGNIDTSTQWLTYTIHFQNTGTAEAQHIYLTDTLDSNIDATSFQLIAYSHQPMVQLKGNNLRFNFPNINLPDSNTNEALSHGYVQYKVKLKDNLPVGTNINNTAFIYFDFNAPVVTNTTNNTIALATSVGNLGLRNADFGLNPNPAIESVRLSMDESMVGSNLTITDITGREVLHSAVQIRNSQFDIRNLSQGVYFVTIANEKGRMTKKLMKQ